MIAGIVLVLGLVMPDLTVRTVSRVAPTIEACDLAATRWISASGSEDGEPGALPRFAMCVVAPVPGRDA